MITISALPGRDKARQQSFNGKGRRHASPGPGIPECHCEALLLQLQGYGIRSQGHVQRLKTNMAAAKKCREVKCGPQC